MRNSCWAVISPRASPVSTTWLPAVSGSSELLLKVLLKPPMNLRISSQAELIASAPGFDAPEVTFTVEVVPARKLLEVVAGPGTLVDPGGQSASVTVGLG